MEESASHHLTNICLAQLRGEMAENDAREARRWPEIMKNLNFEPSENQHFWYQPIGFACDSGIWRYFLTDYIMYFIVEIHS